MKQLIITADDCGLSEGINIATVDLYQRGIITSASVLANFPTTQHALELFKQYPDLEVGIHLNLSDGFPLTEIEFANGLTSMAGEFPHQVETYSRLMLATEYVLEQVRDEFYAQIKVLQEFGIQPQHITTHCHFHVIASVREVIFEIAQKLHIPWIRPFHYRAAITPLNLVLRKQKPLSNYATPMPDYLIPLKSWLDYPPEKLLIKLEHLDGLIEMIIHPSIHEDSSYPMEVRYTPDERYREQLYLERFFQLLENDPKQEISIASF